MAKDKLVRKYALDSSSSAFWIQTDHFVDENLKRSSERVFWDLDFTLLVLQTISKSTKYTNNSLERTKPRHKSRGIDCCKGKKNLPKDTCTLDQKCTGKGRSATATTTT